MAKICWFFGQFFQGQFSFDFLFVKSYVNNSKRLSITGFGWQRIPWVYLGFSYGSWRAQYTAKYSSAWGTPKWVLSNSFNWLINWLYPNLTCTIDLEIACRSILPFKAPNYLVSELSNGRCPISVRMPLVYILWILKWRVLRNRRHCGPSHRSILSVCLLIYCSISIFNGFPK